MLSPREVDRAWELRKQRKLRSAYRDKIDRYRMLLKEFKRKQMIVPATNRQEYLQKWRSNNQDRIRSLNRKHSLLRTQRRREQKLADLLETASADQLQKALYCRNDNNKKID